MHTFKTHPFKAVSFVESSVEKALASAGYLIADIKYDGIRGNIVVDNVADSSWLSRVSTPIPALSHLNGFDDRWMRLLRDDRCCFPDGFMLDGELMVNGVDFNTGSGILRSKWVSNKNEEFNSYDPEYTQSGKLVKNQPFHLMEDRLKVHLYAVLPYHVAESGEEYGVMTMLMQEHVKNMLPLLREHFPEIEWHAAESYDVYDMVELQALYEQKRSEGHEGLIVKDPTCNYKRGKKTGWWKMKPENEADGTVIGLVWGTPGLSNEGKVVGVEVLLENGRVVNACNVSRALMDEFTKTVKEHGEAHYYGWSCQVSYMEETPDGSLRHPTFVMFRGTEDNPSEKM